MPCAWPSPAMTQLMRQAIEDNNGDVFKTIGDAFCAAFATAPDALNAALAAQCALSCRTLARCPCAARSHGAAHGRGGTAGQ